MVQRCFQLFVRLEQQGGEEADECGERQRENVRARLLARESDLRNNAPRVYVWQGAVTKRQRTG